MARTITSANCGLFITVAGLIPAPVQIQGFSADNVFESGDVTTGEAMMGVDGHLSVGWVAAAIPFNITLMADSRSNDVFETITSDEQLNREKRIISMVARIPSLNRSYALNRGFILTYPPITTAGRVMQPRRYSMSFESMTLAPI